MRIQSILIPIVMTAGCIVDVGGDEPDEDFADSAQAATFPSSIAVADIPVQNMVAKPSYLGSFIETHFNTKVTRVTAASAMGAQITHHYAKNQVWNADMTRMAVGNFLLDGSTYRKLDTIDDGVGKSRRRWSSTNPSLMYHVHGVTLRRYNVRTKAITALRTFSGYSKCDIGSAQGNLSIDDRYVALGCFKATDTGSYPKHVVVYDIANNRILGTRSFANEVKWVSMSQRGDYVVVRWFSDRPVESYRRDMSFVSVVGQGGHGDLGIDADGNEVWIVVGPDNTLEMYRLADGRFNVLVRFASKFGGHVSCRNYQRPGWCYFSSHVGTTKIVGGVRLRPNQTTMIPFAHSRSDESDDSYEPEAHAVVSPDGAKMIFKSNWEMLGGEVSSYVAEAR